MATKKQENELERLSEKFKGKFRIIDIREDGVYGYTENSKKYLGSLVEYTKYKRLRTLNKKPLLRDEFYTGLPFNE